MRHTFQVTVEYTPASDRVLEAIREEANRLGTDAHTVRKSRAKAYLVEAIQRSPDISMVFKEGGQS